MTPLPPGALNRLLQTLPPKRPDPFPHLADLNPDQLLQRRVEITGHLKTLEQERQVIDAELLEAFSDAELRFGVRAPGGWVLRSRSRTSWDYSTHIKEQVRLLQRNAQISGKAVELRTTYLVMTQEKY